MWKHPRPLQGFDYIGQHYYSLTWICRNRDPVFIEADRVNLVREQILRACAQCAIEVVADCYMRDHVHNLVRGRTETADGWKFIRLAKQYSGFHFKKRFSVPLWQRYGRDHVIWDVGAVQRVAQYIIENPVRARLVSRADDYPYIGSQVYTRDELMKWAYR